MKQTIRRFITALWLAVLCGSLTSRAATVDVSISGFAYVPSSVTVNVGDTVRWTQNDTAPHTVTSDSGGVLGSPTLSLGQTYSYTFSTAGTYTYHCTYHTYMHGTVVVQGANNIPPTCSITSPADGSSFPSGTSITIVAAASDSDGTVSQVSFFDGNNLLGTASFSPYSYTTVLPPGGHVLTAVAVDNQGAATPSTSITVTVGGANLPPVVSITSPADGASFPLNSSITMTADASDPDGAVTQVRFYEGNNILGAASSGPYSVTTVLSPGSHVLTAMAIDNSGAFTLSTSITITVQSGNTPPSVTITSPSDGASFPAGSSIAISATANDPDGTVAQVQFFDGATSLGVATSSPYSVTTVLAAGGHMLTAVATDNLGATGTSAMVMITVQNSNVPRRSPLPARLTTPLLRPRTPLWSPPPPRIPMARWPRSSSSTVPVRWA